MKKIVLLIGVMLMASAMFAQKANVSKAKNRALAEPPDFEGAVTAINAALEDETTKNLEDTWFVAGLVQYQIQDAERTNKMLQQPYDLDKSNESSLKAIDYFAKAIELGNIPDEKGKIKPKRAKEIREKAKILKNTLLNNGSEYWEKNDFKTVETIYGKYVEMHKSLDLKETDTLLIKVKYNAARAAIISEQHDKAIVYLEEMKNEGYEELGVLQLLFDIYKNTQKDTVNYVRILNEGISRFPEDAYFTLQMTQHYIDTGEKKKAIEFLDKIIENDKDNAELYEFRARLNENIEDVEAAKVDYEKAIAIKPDYAEAYAGIGRLLFNQAYTIDRFADDIPMSETKRYQDEVRRANEIFRQALPYFDKARELEPNNLEYLRNLRALYNRLKMIKQLEEIEELIESLR